MLSRRDFIAVGLFPWRAQASSEYTSEAAVARGSPLANGPPDSANIRALANAFAHLRNGRPR